MYQALYRKWRPRTFDDVIGQRHVTDTLKGQIQNGRPSHAYLFVGTRGTGKTSCAKILAKSINCEKPVNGNPCNLCPACIGIESGGIMDVIEMDAASNNSVDNVRALREEAVFTPVSVNKRVYIIDEVHMLSTAAFNALLKILEEPPEHLVFILATTEIHKVPATILSRCQRFSFKRILPLDIAERLRNVANAEQMVLSDGAAELLSRLADGSMRDALSLLDQCSNGKDIDTEDIMSAIGLAGVEDIQHLLLSIFTGNAADAMNLLDRLYVGGKDMGSILDELITLERDILLVMIAPNSGKGLLSGSFDLKSLHHYTHNLSVQRLLSDLSVIKHSLSEMARSTNRRLTVEMCLIQLCSERMNPELSLKGKITSLPPAENADRQHPEAIPVGKPSNSNTVEPDIKNSSAPNLQPEAKFPSDLSVTKSDDAQFSDLWKRILAAVESEIDIPPYIFLNDKVHSTATQNGNILIIKTKSEIAKNMIDVPTVTGALKTASEQILGHAVALRVVLDENNGDLNTNKLDALIKFNNVKFE